MSELFGFDSTMLPSPTSWRAVADLTGFRPRAVGLYVLGRYASDREHVYWVHSQGAAAWLIYNLATAQSVAGSFDQGYAEGVAAAKGASGIGAPPATLVAADIEASWLPSAAWVGGYSYGVLKYGYRPFVYGSAQQPAFEKAVTDARTMYDAVGRHLGLWEASWDQSLPATITPAWNPPGLPGLPAEGWQYRNAGVTDGIGVDLDLWLPTAGLWTPPAAAAGPPEPTFLPLTVHGASSATMDQFTFPLTLTGSRPHSFSLLHDTGAFCLMLDALTAAACGAPTGGQPLEIQGVTGGSPAYWSVVDVTIAGRTWKAQPCVVDPSAGGCLWGYRFYEDHGYGQAINTYRQTLTIWDGRADALPPVAAA